MAQTEQEEGEGAGKEETAGTGEYGQTVPGGLYREYVYFSYGASISLPDCQIAEDLEGLKVGHDLEGLEEGEARILTLKDSRILDNEGNFHIFIRYYTL
jgi:hypothetical protein